MVYFQQIFRTAKREFGPAGDHYIHVVGHIWCAFSWVQVHIDNFAALAHLYRALA